MAALRQIPNGDLPYDIWLAVGYGLKAALGEEAGWPLFKAWSEQSVKNEPAITEHRWYTIRPTKAGWRYLLKLRETEHG